VAQSLNVTFVTDRVAEVVIAARSGEGFDLSEDGVVDDDAVDGGVVVGVGECLFDVEGVVEGAEFVAEAVGAAGFSGPFGVFFGGGVFVC